MFGLYFWLFLLGFNYIPSYLACLSWLLFFCCHQLVLITTFQNMRSSMLSFGNHVGNELYALKIVVLNARVSIGFTFRGVLQFIVLQLCSSWCFFFLNLNHGLFTADGIFFWVLGKAGGGVSFGDLSLSLILLYLLLLQSPLYEYSFWLF